MKTLAIAALAGSLFTLSAFTTAPDAPAAKKNSVAADKPLASKLKVNTTGSTLAWEAKKVTGGHNGQVKITSGEILTEKNKPAGGTFVIDMNSITCADLTDAEYNKKLIGHLKSDDFFSVEKHPSATFKITSLSPIANAKAGEANYNVKGNLTIKGITNPITFPATITNNNGEMSAKANFTIDRAKWDVRYGSNSFFDNLGDKAIYNDIAFTLDLNAR